LPIGLVTVLEPSIYYSFVKEIGEEPFIDEPYVAISDAYKFSKNLILHLVETEVFERDLGGTTPFISSASSGNDRMFPMSKLHWTTEMLLSEFKNIAVFGVARMHFHSYFDVDHIVFTIQAELLEPPGDAVVADIVHEQFGLRARLHAAPDLHIRELVLDVGGDYHRCRLSIDYSI
jgi:hypothetical protein